MSYHAQLTTAVEANQDFRRVLATGAKSQLVLMTIPPGGDIGTERHDHVEQLFFIHEGSARATLDGQQIDLAPGDVLIVSPGTTHNIEVVGDAPLKLATVYSPPNHLDGRIHPTKADADADHEDESFGHGIT